MCSADYAVGTVGAHCSTDGDCASSFSCLVPGNTCQLKPDGSQCGEDTDCGSGSCALEAPLRGRCAASSPPISASTNPRELAVSRDGLYVTEASDIWVTDRDVVIQSAKDTLLRASKAGHDALRRVPFRSRTQRMSRAC